MGLPTDGVKNGVFLWFPRIAGAALFCFTRSLDKFQEPKLKKTDFWCAGIVLMVPSHASQAQILMGQTAGFTGVVGAGVKETTEGAKLYLDSINAKGGIAGQKIELVSLDDKFEPKLAAENAGKLIEPLPVRQSSTD